MAKPVSTLQRIDALIEQMQSSPAAENKSTFDVAWCPAVPNGHTGFSWGSEPEPTPSAQGKAAKAAPAAAAAAAAPVAAKAAAPSEEKKAAPAAAAEKKKDEKKGQQDNSNKKEKQQGTDKANNNKKTDAAPKEPKEPKGDAAKADKPEKKQPWEELPFAGLDIRVGVIKDCKKHPDADALYVEQIDLGEKEGPRQIVSGLVKFVPLDKMLGARVLVIANLKEGKLRGEKSQGMVLAASDANKTQVVLVTPPEGAKIGERVLLEGKAKELADIAPEKVVNIQKAVNSWAATKDDLKTNEKGEAAWKGIRFVTSGGVCTATLSGATIS